MKTSTRTLNTQPVSQPTNKLRLFALTPIVLSLMLAGCGSDSSTVEALTETSITDATDSTDNSFHVVTSTSDAIIRSWRCYLC